MQKRKQTNMAKKTPQKEVPYKKRVVPKSEQGILRTGGYYGRYNLSMGSCAVEKKYFDTTKGSATPAATGTILNLSLNLIPQGTTESSRIGRKVIVTNLYLHGQMILPTTNDETATSDTLRLIVYIDKQANGATATIGDLLQTTDWRSFRNLSNQERFVFLKDKYYDLNATVNCSATTQTTGDFAFHFKCYKKLDLPIEFSSTTGAITEIKSNNIGVACISEGGVAQINYIARIRYTDN